MVSRSNVHRQVFWRRVRSGIRTSIAALLTAVLALTPIIAHNLTIAFFASVTAIIITDSSLGRTIHNAVMVFWACVVSSVASLICVEIFGRSYTAMLLCLTATAFLIACPDVHVLIKKFGLALAGIDFITFAIRPDTTSITFPFRLGATTMLGALCAVLSMILPVPLSATSLVRDRAELAAKSLAALLSTQMDAFCAVEGRNLSKLKVQAGMLRQAVLTNLQGMKDRQDELWWEFAGGAPARKLRRLLKVFDTILMHSASMDMALQTGHIHESPKVLLRILRPSLVDIGVWTGSVLGLAIHDFKNKKIDPTKVEQVAAKGTELLKRFNATLQAARERAYYGLKGTETDAETDSSSEESSQADVSRRRRRSRVETLMKCSVESLITSQFFLFNARHIAQEALSLTKDSPPVRFQMPRLSLTQTRRPTQRCENPNCPSVGRIRPSSATIAPGADSRRTSETPQEFTSVPVPEGGSAADVSRPPGSDKPGDLTGGAKKSRFKGVIEFAGRFKPNERKLKPAFRIAVAVCMASALGMKVDSPFPFLAAATVGVLVGGYQGGSFRVALNRFQGTVAGAVYGYLVILAVHGHPVAVGALLVPWVALVTFIRYSKAYGYSGVVAGFTAAIIMLGYKSSNQPVRDYALGRITETCIGIVTFIVVETCIWPNRASLLERAAVISTLENARACFAATVRSYMEDECPHCRQQAVEQVAATEKNIAALLAKQGPLIDEAAVEPDFWRAPFPVPVYVKLVDLQKRMARFLYAMDCSLRATGLETSGEQSEKLVKPLQGPLRSLEAEVLLTLDSLIIALKTPPRDLESVANPLPRDGNPESELTAAAAAANRPNEAGKRTNGAAERTHGTADCPVKTGESTAEDGVGVAESPNGASSARMKVVSGTDGIDSQPDTAHEATWQDSEQLEGANSQRAHKSPGSQHEEYGPESSNRHARKQDAFLTESRQAVDIESQEVHSPDEHSAESKSKGGKKKRHKHHGFHPHHRRPEKPVDEQVFQHPLPGTDAAGRLGTAGAVNIRHVFREFEDKYEDVISGLISVKLSNPDVKIVENTAMLSFNALVFSMRALIAEANDLENTVRELLQVESPIDLTKCINASHEYSESEPFLNKVATR